MENREKLKDKKRIVVKVGTSSLIHPKTGQLNLFRLEKLVRVLTDIHNSGKDVILVSSGAIGVVFVHDRNNAQTQQLVKCISRIKPAHIVQHRLFCDKDLG